MISHSFKNFQIVNMPPVVYKPLLELIAREGLYIAGSYASWMLHGHIYDINPGDIDIYGFKDYRHANKVEKMIQNLFAKDISTSNNGLSTYYTTDYTWGDPEAPFVHGLKPVSNSNVYLPINLINYHGVIGSSDKFDIGNMQHILSSFDFAQAACAVYFDINEGKFSGFAHRDSGDKELKLLLPLLNPYKTLVRILKYAKKGFDVNGSQFLEVLYEWERMPKHIKEELEEGYDVGFEFMETEHDDGSEYGDYIRVLDHWVDRLNMDDLESISKIRKDLNNNDAVEKLNAIKQLLGGI